MYTKNLSAKAKIVSLMVLLAVSLVFSHLSTGRTVNRFNYKPSADPFSTGAEKTAAFSYKGEWDPTEQYAGDYKTMTGDTVKWGTFNGEDLFWWAKFWSEGDEPGQFAEGGGTSPWVLINSFNFARTEGSNSYQWKGWNGDIENSIAAGDAVIPTFKDGAQGAYTMIHDDIGAMPFETSVKPGWEVAKDFPEIKVAWGVFVGNTEDWQTPRSEESWQRMRDMVKDGHEMVNHSMDHTSAAEQWLWYYPGDTIPTKELTIPRELTGLVVQGIWPQETEPIWPVPAQNTSENDLVKVTFEPYWTGFDPSPDNGDDAILDIETKSGVEIVEMPTGQKMYVKYTKRDTTGGGDNEGYIAPLSVGWYEYNLLQNDFPEYATSIAEEDQGRPGFICKMWTTEAWDAARTEMNMDFSKDSMEAHIYGPLRDGNAFGEHFPAHKETEYYVYPFDAYSEKTHANLESLDYVGARGGAKSGVPLPGDFYHPYRIDFDAFFMLSANADINYPDNPHKLMSLDQMPNDCRDKKGYMIREFHAVTYVDGEANWDDANDQAKGGWWGGIPAYLYREHLTQLQNMIDANELVVYTPSHAVKYRMTANVASGATLTNNGDDYTLSVSTSEDIGEKYRDEISVIVKLDEGTDKMDVQYVTADAKWGDHPVRKPRKMTDDGTVWSVNVMPYAGDAKIYPGMDWTGDINPVVNDNKASKIAKRSYSYNGIQNGKVSLRLPAGKYTAELFDMSGRRIRSVNVISENGLVNTGLDVNGLASNMFILNVKQNSQSVLNQRILLNN